MDTEKVKLLFLEHLSCGIKHQDYDRVVKLAEEYRDIFTGIGIPKYIKRFKKREPEDMFRQRIELYESTIPSTVNSISQTFNKALRSNRIYAYVAHVDPKKHEEILERLDEFYVSDLGMGLDMYLQEKYRYYNTYDPNAFMCIEFGEFDPKVEKARAFPLEYTSKEVLNFEYKNGKLIWLLAQKGCRYKCNSKEYKTGSKYFLYVGDYCYTFTEIDYRYRFTDIENPEIIDLDINDSYQSFVFQEWDLKSNGIPLRRFGYQKDPVTNNRTCVSILHPALAFFKKEIKTGSEFDITMTMHVFPQKIQYGQICEGDKANGQICNNGADTDGNACKLCNGTGLTVPVHTSAQDILWVKPPVRTDDPILDLEKAVVYKSPNIDVVKFQKDYSERLVELAKMAIFPSESVIQASINKTATEVDNNMDSINDTLYPFGIKYSSLWKFAVEKIAAYADNSDGLELYHSFPKDLKLKSKDSLLLEAKLAKESGLNQNVINALNDDILEIQYCDDRDTLTKLRIQNKFYPFGGKTPDEIQAILSTNDITPYHKIMYIYFDAIFKEIDNEVGEIFYTYPYMKQKEIVQGKVKDYESAIKEAQMNSTPTLNFDVE